jgi:hypothetical protein
MLETQRVRNPKHSLLGATLQHGPLTKLPDGSQEDLHGSVTGCRSAESMAHKRNVYPTTTTTSRGN